METEPAEISVPDGTAEARKILVVSASASFSEDLVTYAVHLAERLDYGLLALNVDTEFSGESFRHAAVQSMMDFVEAAFQSGIQCAHAVKSGSVVKAVADIHHETRRIEIVVTDFGINHTEIIQKMSIPIFKVIPDTTKEKGEKTMSTRIEKTKFSHLVPTIGFGSATAAMYAGIFMNADTIMSHFTRGGWYAMMPIATVFAFSFVHGSFASRLWSLLGIEAAKKDRLRKTEKKVSQPQKRASKKPRAYAYVNPFHRI